ncbi:GIY-YIG nuclease family protein [Halalkalibacter nanhaiisediminis]|uniref:Putative endonuclease n=1 Tax=Halalkalibacter nanhaiisediminis TaxID=688079 RepID=A0A562Q907_9BACI|nr:GIY-YIG nuclease family protein [Halalkalibacter nanhaiisediminis]TWI53247.1 putative endonuclease [Halalkalibacter nanhaiisediminis]
MNHFIYILECKDGTWYTGYTTDVERRLKMHEQGKGAKYTRGRGPFSLVYQKAYQTKAEALRAEYDLKQLKRKQKEEFVDRKENQDETTK